MNSDPVNSDSVFIPALVIFNPQFQGFFFVADDCLVTYILSEIIFFEVDDCLVTYIYRIVYKNL